MSDNIVSFPEGIAASSSLQKSAGGSGGGDTYDPGMELLNARVQSLEGRMDRFDTKLDGIDARLRAVEISVASLGGKIDGLGAKLDLVVAKMPSWWQAPASAAGLLAIIVGLIAVAKALHLTV